MRSFCVITEFRTTTLTTTTTTTENENENENDLIETSITCSRLSAYFTSVSKISRTLLFLEGRRDTKIEQKKLKIKKRIILEYVLKLSCPVL